MSMEAFKAQILQKKVAVAGIGVSNMPLIEFLVQCGAQVTACDKKEETQIAGIPLLQNLGVALRCGSDYLEQLDCDWFFRTPGMYPELPEIRRLRENGVTISSEMELFFALCPAQIIAVTGSDGKTTTATLIAKMLQQAGYRCWLGGNIGTPLIGRIEQIQPEDKVVLELSSFQLFTMQQSPGIAVITNVAPNHLDWHSSMEEYVFAKKQIFLHQKSADCVILNDDNEQTRAFAAEATGTVRFFSRKRRPAQGVYLENDAIWQCGAGQREKILDIDKIRIPGVHNIENYMAAIAALRDMVSAEDIAAVAENFAGVAHRIEFIREKDGIRFYNDSIASSPTRTAAALRAFGQKVILIAGGYDKKIPFDELGKLIQKHVKCLVLVGDTSEKIKDAVQAAGDTVPILLCADLHCAVRTAYDKARAGDVVLLSPACASFDQFQNFERRGNAFRDYVNKL